MDSKKTFQFFLEYCVPNGVYDNIKIIIFIYSMNTVNTMNTTVISVIIIGLILGYISTSGVKSQKNRVLDIVVIGPLMI